MIWRPRWRNATTHTDESPFNSWPAVRPLRLTFHITEEPATEEAEALAVIQNILRPELIKWMETAGGSAQSLSIGTQIVGEDEQGVARVLNREGNEVGSAVFWPERWREVAATVATTSNRSRDRVHDDVMVVAGHEAWQHDLLVTTAPALLANRNVASFIDANVCTYPSDEHRLDGDRRAGHATECESGGEASAKGQGPALGVSWSMDRWGCVASRRSTSFRYDDDDSRH